MKPSEVTDSNGKPLEDVDIGEMRMCLLVQAFDGRPIRVAKESNRSELLLIIVHEHSNKHCDMRLTETDLELLETDTPSFKKNIAEPIVNNLDSAVYPERFDRFIAAARRSAKLLSEKRPAA